jgi:hypothetical protein
MLCDAAADLGVAASARQRARAGLVNGICTAQIWAHLRRSDGLWAVRRSQARIPCRAASKLMLASCRRAQIRRAVRHAERTVVRPVVRPKFLVEYWVSKIYLASFTPLRDCRPMNPLPPSTAFVHIRPPRFFQTDSEAAPNNKKEEVHLHHDDDGDDGCSITPAVCRP